MIPFFDAFIEVEVKSGGIFERHVAVDEFLDSARMLAKHPHPACALIFMSEDRDMHTRITEINGTLYTHHREGGQIDIVPAAGENFIECLRDFPAQQRIDAIQSVDRRHNYRVLGSISIS